MGGARVKVRSLRIVEVDAENRLLLVKGAAPGSQGGYLVVTRAKR
jgi:large subunit ribosomal protein L3